MELKSGDVYLLDREGYVVERSDGPQGFDYERRWRILGVTTRHHAGDHRIVPLESIIEGAPIGQGWVHDVDHGYHRMWGSPSNRKMRRLTRIEKRPI
jgi:hypothetical protein